MCKVLIFTNTSKLPDLEEAANTIFTNITDTEQDGFGYAIQGLEGVYGEKTTNMTWKYGSKSFPFTEAESLGQKFGKETKPVGPALFHGRTSTNNVNLVNTHPLEKDNWWLIHNGVVTNIGPDYKMKTSNDTEHVLHHLVTGGIKALETNLTGYYAVGAIDPSGNLHVIRDNTANLYCVWSPEIESYIFGTTIELIQTVLDELEIEYDTIQEFKQNNYCIFNGNVLKEHVTFKPKGWGDRESQYMSESLGYEPEYPRGNIVRRVSEAEVQKGGTIEDWSERKYREKTHSLYEGYGPSESEERDSWFAFLHECEQVDASYTIHDWQNKKLTPSQFKKLDDIAKANCHIVRHDGTLMDADDYYNEKLA